jgi:hypothetical protein
MSPQPLPDKMAAFGISGGRARRHQAPVHDPSAAGDPHRRPGGDERGRARLSEAFDGTHRPGHSPAFWAGFIAFVLAMLALDLFVLGGKTAQGVGPGGPGLDRGLGDPVPEFLRFAVVVAGRGTAGREVANAKALEFLTGYLIELSLSVDNIFVFIMIFTFFAVPAEYQRRVLVYGVLGAIVLRATMILGGACWWPSSTGCSTCSACSWWSPASRC